MGSLEVSEEELPSPKGVERKHGENVTQEMGTKQVVTDEVQHKHIEDVVDEVEWVGKVQLDYKELLLYGYYPTSNIWYLGYFADVAEADDDLDKTPDGMGTQNGVECVFFVSYSCWTIQTHIFGVDAVSDMDY